MGGRQALLKDLFGEVPSPETSDELWSVLKLRLENKQLIPIISNSVSANHIFDTKNNEQLGMSQGAAEETEEHSLQLNEVLARHWAEFIEYPLAENPLQLPQIAQYNQVTSQDSDQAKIGYLTFLKLSLLRAAKKDIAVEAVVDSFLMPLRGLSIPEMAIQLRPQDFSEIAFQLGYPKFTTAQPNPLNLLAQLPLPLYVTTSHHDFMERALLEVGKEPRTQVCCWFGDPHKLEWYDRAPAETNLNVEASETCPIVYHLYGLEKYPSSIVISEDDYMDFLVKVSEDGEVIPDQLRGALRRSSLLLLGYHLRDWDFRALFRGIIKPLRSAQGIAHFAIQLNPRVRQLEADPKVKEESLKEAQEYLQKYFNPSNFKVHWQETTDFVQELVERWRKSHQ